MGWGLWNTTTLKVAPPASPSPWVRGWLGWRGWRAVVGILLLRRPPAAATATAQHGCFAAAILPD